MPDTYSPASPNLDIKRRQLQYRQGPEQLGAIQPLPTRKQSTSEPQLSFRGRCIRTFLTVQETSVRQVLINEVRSEYFRFCGENDA